MRMWLRSLLRKWIGWDELETRFASADSVSALRDRADAQNLDIEGLRNRLRSNRLRTQVKVSDWETVQQEFADNLENYKEK